MGSTIPILALKYGLVTHFISFVRRKTKGLSIASYVASNTIRHIPGVDPEWGLNIEISEAEGLVC